MVGDEHDLARRLSATLEVARETLAAFGEDGFSDAHAPQNNFKPDKVVAETAMVVYAAAGARRFPAIARQLDTLIGALAGAARTDSMLLNMALFPARSLDFAVAHILLGRLGAGDPAVCAFLDLCLEADARNGHERPAFARMERNWIMSVKRGARDASAWRADLAACVLAAPLDLLGGLREDAYAFTHLLMYVTDFGAAPSCAPRAADILLGEAEALLAATLDSEDYDLAGEALLAWPFLNEPWNAAAAFGFGVLAEIEDVVGVLPNGLTDEKRLAALPAADKKRYALGTAYHTAYVMGLLCAAALRPGRAPPSTLTGPAHDPAANAALLSRIDTRRGHWARAYHARDAADRARLTPLLRDIALVQAYRRHDYGAMSDILAIAAQYRLPDSALTRQGCELLARLAQCAPLLGRAGASRSGAAAHALA